jgi:hypothetical protein
MRALIGFACCVCAAFAAMAGETRKVEEQNFAITIPDWWMATTPAPQGTVVAVESPKKDRTLIAVASELPPRELETVRGEMSAGARKQLEAQSFEVKGETQVESGGLKWTAIEASALHLKTVIWIAVVPGRGYLLRSDNKAGGNPAEDPEIVATLHSFRLLWPVRADGSVAAPAGRAIDAFDPDSAPGLTLAIIGACGALALVFLLLAIFSGRRKKRRRTA